MNGENLQGNVTPKHTPRNYRSQLRQGELPPTPLVSAHVFYSHQKKVSLESEGVIYGTNICVDKTMNEIRQFLLNFQVTCEVEDQFISEKVYLVKMNNYDQHEKKVKQFIDEQPKPLDMFDVDAMHIYKHSQKMYLQLIYFPVEIITCFDIVLHELFQKWFIQTETDPQTRQRKSNKNQQLKVGIVNLHRKDQVCIKDLKPKMLGRLVSIVGMVIRMSEVYPEMKTGCFRCLHCKNSILVPLQNARVQQPKSCQKCRKKYCLQLIHNACKFTNKQYIKFQQLLQNVSQGHSPTSVTIIAYDSNVDRVRPGEAIEITGIYRCHPVKVNRGKTDFRQVFNTYFDLISVQKLDQRSHRIKVNKQSFSEDERNEFLKMANKETIIDDLANSFAPSIYGHKQIKKGFLTQLFGGSKKERSNGTNIRSQINICLVGDPSTAKSQMLIQSHRIAPRSIYTCGRGSSAVGLTACVRKDPETREFVLQSGALVLSDKGICCIDEFDKMEENTRAVLLEVMEQQTISIAKAGIVCQLNSRTSILAAANPIKSSYDIKKSVIENINLPPALLSRFDLIYIMLDVPNEEEDKKIAAHILDIYTESVQATTKRIGRYPLQLLANYISYAHQVTPKLSDEAALRLQKQYIALRKLGATKQTITATPRLLESMIRLSESFAKMRLSNEVTVEDVEEAIELINFATLKSATDPQTGIIDMDIITTGRRTSTKIKIKNIADKIKVMLEANQSKYSEATTIQKFQQDYNKLYPLSKDPVTREEFIDALIVLKSEDYIYLFGQDKKRPKFKLQQFNEAE